MRGRRIKRQHAGIRVLGLPNNHGSTARESVSFLLLSMGQLYPSLKRRALLYLYKKRRDDFHHLFYLFCISSKNLLVVGHQSSLRIRFKSTPITSAKAVADKESVAPPKAMPLIPKERITDTKIRFFCWFRSTC